MENPLQSRPRWRWSSSSRAASRNHNCVSSDSASPQSLQHNHATCPEAEDRAESGDQHQRGPEMEHVAKNGRHGKQEPHNVEPQRGMNGGLRIFSQAQLQQKGGEPNRRDDDQGEWTRKSSSARVQHNDRERQKKQSSRNHAPTSRLGLRRRIGCDAGQAGRPKLYRPGGDAFNIRRLG